MAFSRDRKRVATLFTNGIIEIKDTTSGRIDHTLRRQGYGCTSLVFSPNGNLLAVGAFREVILWDLTTGKEFASGIGEHVSSVEFTQDSRQLIYTRMYDVCAMSVRTRIVTPLKFPRMASLPTYSQNSELAAGTIETLPLVWESYVGVWDTRSGKLMWTVPGEPQRGPSKCLFLNKALLVTSEDSGRLNVWNGRTHQKVRALKGASPYEPPSAGPPIWDCVLAATGNGDVLACSCGREVVLWDTRSGKLLQIFPEPHVMALAFSQDGRWLMSANAEQSIKTWAVPSGSVNHEVKN